MTRTSPYLSLLSVSGLAQLSVVLIACGSTVPTGPTLGDDTDEQTTTARTEEAPPLGKLPEGVTPTRYAIELSVVPTEERFSGVVDVHVTLDAARTTIWMHGRDLDVASATVTPAAGAAIEGTWEQVDEEGVAALRLASAVGPGDVVIHIEYTAPFNEQLEGLYKVEAGGESYAFTQFEAVSARRCFPGFDEPRFKTPFDLTLAVRAADVAAANTQAVGEEAAADGMKRVRFATTQPIPTYLVALTVGPLDVVEAEAIPANDVRRRPLPFRGLAIKGQGARLAYALRETPAILAELERYFGIEYPYDKLDIVAVPDFGAGAMENVGLVTFREWLLLVDEATAEEDQKRAFAGVMAHELAHQWFGNLVTMPWWDDIWLNEAFATWMATKIIRARYPEYQAEVGQLSGVERAMGQDSLTTARRIRQPIESNHDIRNAFDGITYSKGGGVLEMFERYLGVETFQRGLALHLTRHRFATATADDLMASLGEAAGRDVATPFSTFLEQPGVPFLAVHVDCSEDAPTLTLTQSRYLPVGSSGDRNQTWKIPMCVRYEVAGEVKSQCTLLEGREGRLTLEASGCPAWVMPNADGAGYFRFALESADLEKLRTRGFSKLTPRERLAVADSLSAAFANDSIPAADVMSALAPLARDDIRAVATTPMALVGFARDRVADAALRPRVDAWGQHLYAPLYRRLGWAPRRGRAEDGETKLLRASVVSFLALDVEDATARREAVRRGRAYVGFGGDGALHPNAVDPNLADVALAVAVQEGDAAFFDALLALFIASDDAVVRGRLLSALSHTRDETLAERARALALDERLRLNEIMTPLFVQMEMPDTREAAWRWVKEHFDPLVARIGPGRAGYTPYAATSFCEASKVEEVRAFFAPRIEELPGGPRNLASALEALSLCAARVDAQGESMRTFFATAR